VTSGLSLRLLEGLSRSSNKKSNSADGSRGEL
jgi:hypothetical protein